MKCLAVYSLIPMVCLWVATGCGSLEPAATDDVADVTGTWVLVKKRLGEGTAWSEFPPTVQYIKHVTPTHFTWAHYDTGKDQLLGTAGGPYTIKDDVYTERIDYFYPPGSNQVGTTLSFPLVIKDGDWYHSGYFYEIMRDSVTGEEMPGQSVYFEEVWTRYTTE